MCYIKMVQWERVLENCKFALEIDPKSTKALFRRAQAYEAKKDWDNALSDLKLASETSPDDPNVKKSELRIQKLILKEKQKEKKMYKNIFG